MGINIAGTDIYQGLVEKVKSTPENGIDPITSFSSIAEFQAAGGSAANPAPVLIGDAQYSDGVWAHNGEPFDNRIVKIKKLVDDAVSGAITGAQWFVIGDSTRSEWTGGLASRTEWGYDNMLPVYLYQRFLSPLNITYERAHASGQSAANFKNNIGANSLVKARLDSVLSRITGTGANAVVEYGLGINDFTDLATWNASEKAAFLSNATDAINAILAQAPLANIVLVEPVKTGNDDRNVELNLAYRRLAKSLNLPLVSAYAAMEAVHGNASYYVDATHPNDAGHRRLFNFMMRCLLPSKYAADFRADWLTSAPIPLTPRVGFWRTTGSIGEINTDATSRCALQVNLPADGASAYLLDTGGTRYEVFCYDAAGALIGTNIWIIADSTTKYFAVPNGTVSVRVNLAVGSGTTWDALNYSPRLVPVYMSPENINSGLAI